MAKEYAFGIIPLQYQQQQWVVLLVQLLSGKHWGFPKGHGLPQETHYETACRELYEETQLRVEKKIGSAFFTEQYQVTRREEKRDKSVLYFPATVTGRVKLQKGEIADYQWISISEAEKAVTFPEGQQMYRQFYRWFCQQDQQLLIERKH